MTTFTAFNNTISFFFAFLILLISVPVIIYSKGYMTEYKKEYSIWYFWLLIILFINSMILTVFANNIISFMVFWELMSLSSFLLVIYEHKKYTTIQTGIFYFIMTHISGLTLMVMFALLYKYTGKIYFEEMATVTLEPKQISTIFYLSLIGFGAKAGIVPLHDWLPKAHPAAPSNISSLMSGVMLKVAIYGFLLINFVIIKNYYAANGIILLVLSILTAVFAILNGIFQKDIKTLLAYSSIENVGIIFSTIALSIILKSENLDILALYSLTAALFHILNHGVFKSLLFLSAGSVVYATSTKNMNELGGLHKVLKITTVFSFIGVAAMSAMPPLNGFASEFLIFRSFIQSAHFVQDKYIVAPLTFSIALLALTSSGAVYSALKYFGITFLGEPRSEKAINVHKIPVSMNIGMGILSAYIIILGIFSPFVARFISKVPQSILNLEGIEPMFLSNDITYISIALLVIALILISLVKKNRIERYETWACGFNIVKPYMQYSADGFSQPVSRYFGSVAGYEKEVKKREEISLKTKLHDIFYTYIYKPIIESIDLLASTITRMHYGKIQLYIMYILIALFIAIYFSLTLI